MRTRFGIGVAIVVCIGFLWSCGKDENHGPNLAPETVLVSAPRQDSQHSYRVDIAWNGTDADGVVNSFEIAWHDGMTYSGSLDELDWEPTAAFESTFTVSADTCPAPATPGPCHTGHTFFVRAVDNDGAKDPTPAYVGFDATTSRPRSRITYPPRPGGEFFVTLPTCVKIGWEADDPDGEAVAYRYARKKLSDPPPGPPPEGDTRWSPWGADKQVIVTLAETDPDDPWSFYVQAKDNAGAIENSFEDGRNHITIYVDPSLDSRPSISICCVRGACGEIGRPSVGCRSTPDTTFMDVPLSVHIGDTLSFLASASPGQYAKKVERIAFAVNDPTEPGSWKDYTKAANLCYPGNGEIFIAPPNINTIYVWVRDDYCEYGSVRRAYVKIEGHLP
jgi:hypothetical protein